MRSFALLALTLAVVACNRKEPEPAAASSAAQGLKEAGSKDPALKDAASNATASTATEKNAPAFERLPAPERLVAIGDLHGDFEATRRVFRLAGAIDASDRWIGGKLQIVQTGDQLDRGDGEREIFDFLTRLEGEAKAAGGALHVLNGNHEVMNAMGDYRYVTPGAIHDFDSLKPDSPHAGKVTGAYQSRAAAFLPGGAMALELAKRPLVLVVGDSIFVHAGVKPEHIRGGLAKLNQNASQFLQGKSTSVPGELTDPEGPLWTRIYGSPTVPPAACELLTEVLRLTGAVRLVVGHTVQEHGVSEACGGHLYRIDVGLSAYYGELPVSVLEITPAGAKILTESNP